MAQVDTNRAAIEIGAGIQISGTMAPGGKLLLVFPNRRVEAKIVRQSADQLILEIDNDHWKFVPWSEGDDPLPDFDGPFTRWTCTEKG